MAVQCYVWPPSVADGEAFTVHASSTARAVEIEIARVGGERTVVWRSSNLMIVDHPMGDDVVASGCDWPAVAEVTVAHWPSGYYEVVARPSSSDDSNDDLAATSAFVVVRPSPGSANRVLLALSTNTWYAYNDVGGANCYTGAPIVSIRRPLARGFLDRPAGRGDRLAAVDGPDPTMRAFRDHVRAHDLSMLCGAAGWWNWERVFVAWAEQRGWGIDVVTNLDLERHPDIIERYPLYCSIGHDEYWTAGMRDTVEHYVAHGGNAAFLSGNTCYWQVRFENEDATMIAYKQRLEDDPVVGTDRAAEVTSIWSDHSIGRPENTMTGVSFVRGGYARIGRRSPAGPGGYIVHRPDHWLFEGTGLAYGDVLGGAVPIVGYECDGCDFTYVDGLPAPTGRDGTPATFTILGSAPAQGFDHETALLPIPPGDRSEIEFNALRVFGSLTEETLARVSHGHAVLGTYTTTGGGTVVTSGCTDWTYGLRSNDPRVARVTRNILTQLT